MVPIFPPGCNSSSALQELLHYRNAFGRKQTEKIKADCTVENVLYSKQIKNISNMWIADM